MPGYRGFLRAAGLFGASSFLAANVYSFGIGLVGQPKQTDRIIKHMCEEPYVGPFYKAFFTVGEPARAVGHAVSPFD